MRKGGVEREREREREREKENHTHRDTHSLTRAHTLTSLHPHSQPPDGDEYTAKFFWPPGGCQIEGSVRMCKGVRTDNAREMKIAGQSCCGFKETPSPPPR